MFLKTLVNAIAALCDRPSANCPSFSYKMIVLCITQRGKDFADLKDFIDFGGIRTATVPPVKGIWLETISIRSRMYLRCSLLM